MDFDAGRAAVVAAGPPDAVVGRWPGLVCVAQSSDPVALASLLDLCAAVVAEVGPSPGRALARRLAMWLGSAAAVDDLRFGTLAVAGEQWAVFLSGEVELVVPEQDLALSGTQSAAWTDRLLQVPERPVALALEGVAVPPDMAGGVHDLRLGVVPGSGVVLVPGSAGPSFAKAPEPERAMIPTPPTDVLDGPISLPVDAGASWPPVNGAAAADEPYAAAEHVPSGFVRAEPAPEPVGPAWDETPPRQPSQPPLPVGAPEGRHEADPSGAPDPDTFSTEHVGPGWPHEIGGAGPDEPAGPPVLDEPAHDRFAEFASAPAEVEEPPSPPLAADPGPLTPPGASTAIGGAVEPSAPPPPPPPAPRRAERILGVAPTEPPRAPLHDGAPVTALAEGEEKSETTVLDQQPKAQGHLCSRGHLNDPRSHFCVLCGIRMNERTGVLVVGSRPPLGLLVFDDGSTYTVDAEYLVGRMPEADQRVRSGVLRAIIIEDRSGSVSRVHAEVRLNGWDVMLVDSGSRNGTYLSAPGEPGWTPLPPHQSRRMVPGTKVRLGARTFTFESPSGVR